MVDKYIVKSARKLGSGVVIALDWIIWRLPIPLHKRLTAFIFICVTLGVLQKATNG